MTKCCWDRLHPTERVEDWLIGEDNRALNTQLGHEAFHTGGSTRIQRDSHRGQSLAGIFLLQFHEARDLDAARPAPGRPKVENDDLPGKPGGFHQLAVEIFKVPRRPLRSSLILCSETEVAGDLSAAAKISLAQFLAQWVPKVARPLGLEPKTLCLEGMTGAKPARVYWVFYAFS